MGVLRLMSTILRHKATKKALIENVPIIDYLLVDYNGNIHYVLQKTITELNEIIYYLYHQEIFSDEHTFTEEYATYASNMSIDEDDLLELIEEYQEDYQIGNTYAEVVSYLSNEENIIKIISNETINYTRSLIASLNRGFIKKVFIALDGVPSSAKIKEQRNRRYVGAQINNLQKDIIKKYKFSGYQIDLFYYRSMICSTTSLMKQIEEQLPHLNIDLDIEISFTNEKGEGEKKIMDAIRHQTEFDNYCVMSPDSDMIILMGLLSRDQNFINKKIYNFRIDYQKKNQYQFFDLKKLIDNFRIYYSNKLDTEISDEKMLDMLFMLLVFGNDFLPKIEPLDITDHFDDVCQKCLRLSTETHFIVNHKLNYKYLQLFFSSIKDIVTGYAIEQHLNNRYSNYTKLCHQLSINKNHMLNKHPDLKPIQVDHTNLHQQVKIVNEAYDKLMTHLKKNKIEKQFYDDFYDELNNCINSSYLLIVLPRLAHFPGSSNIANHKQFLIKLVKYFNENRDNPQIRFSCKLKLNTSSDSLKKSKTEYQKEMEKMRTMAEPYKTIFQISTIDLVAYDFENNQVEDLSSEYYQKYFAADTTKNKVVKDYLTGIEWLYQYYITNSNPDWTGWYYPYTHPPLIDDILIFLESEDMNTFHQTIEYPQNTMTNTDHYQFVTPNDYTQVGVSPNLSEVLHLFDGSGAPYLNRTQIRWHMI